jgi:hypothetical protein
LSVPCSPCPIQRFKSDAARAILELRAASDRPLHLNCEAVVATLDQPSTGVYVCGVLWRECELNRHQQYGTGVNKEI